MAGVDAIRRSIMVTDGKLELKLGVNTDARHITCTQNDLRVGKGGQRSA